MSKTPVIAGQFAVPILGQPRTFEALGLTPFVDLNHLAASGKGALEQGVPHDSPSGFPIGELLKLVHTAVTYRDVVLYARQLANDEQGAQWADFCQKVDEMFKAQGVELRVKDAPKPEDA